MPLSFLAPVFLAALAALAVPVIVHLIQRERKEAVQFPSLMFLSQVPYKSMRRRRLRNVALFLLRSAALILIVAAFARPWIDRDLDAASPLATAREVVILLDRSYSMGWGDHWQRAVSAAQAAIDAVGPDDRATLVFFDGGAAAANQATADRARLRVALDGVEPGSGVTRYAPALKLAQSILEASEKPRREVVIISDFQRSGWDGGEGVRMPARTQVTPVAITDEATPDLAVAGVTLRREQAGGRERVTATARVVNAGTGMVRATPVTLALNGRELETKTADIPAGDAATVTFSPFTVAEANQRGEVSIPRDELPADDAFRFVLSPNQAVGVLIADGGGPRSSLYLERVLAIGDQPAFRADVRPAAGVRASDLEGRRVVIWNDAAFPGGEPGRRLRTFVEGGGGLILVLGPRGNWDAAGEVLPGSVGRVVDRDDPGGALGFLDYGHPVFEVFRAPRSGDLASARFFRYRPTTTDTSVAVLARLDDGAPALLERRIGEGRVLVWTSTLDNFWNDLPVQPVFLPLVHQLVRYAAGWIEPSPWFTVGQVVNVAGPSAVAADTAAADSAAATAPAAAADRELMAITPAGERVSVQSGLLPLQERGYYQVRPAGQSEDERVIGVNVDLAESDLSLMDAQELVSAVQPRGDATASGREEARIRPEDRERRQALWWYLLVVAFVFLVAETMWSNSISRRRVTAR